MKRFWKEVRTATEADGSRVLLDGRPVTTPAKRPLLLPTPALAEAVAAEWAASGETLRPDEMPLTQLCCTALDLTLPREPAIRAQLAAYGGTDLLCHWAERPQALIERQERGWRPLLEWAVERYGAPLAVTSGLMAVEQPPESLAALAAALEDYGDFALTALAQLVQASGSLLLGLAVAEGRLTPDEAFEASELDATFQMELWGEDEEAVERRRALLADLTAAQRLLALCRPQ